MASTPPTKASSSGREADDGARAERERLGEIPRGLVEDARARAGSRRAARRARPATPRQSAWKTTICTIARAPCAVQAQIGDRLAALGDGQQQRVEREQEAEQRADRREQAARLVARAQRLAQQRDVLVGRRDRERPAGERAAARERTAASWPGCASTRMRVIAPVQAASCCRRASGITATARARARRTLRGRARRTPSAGSAWPRSIERHPRCPVGRSASVADPERLGGRLC